MVEAMTNVDVQAGADSAERWVDCGRVFEGVPDRVGKVID